MSSPSRAGTVGGIAGEQLRSFIARYERLEEEIKALNDDKKDLLAELVGQGFDKAIFKKLIAIRKRDRAELDEEETLLEIYMRAAGMLPDVGDAEDREAA